MRPHSLRLSGFLAMAIAALPLAISNAADSVSGDVAAPNPNLGRITGPVQEGIALAAGETRKLEGEFVLKIEQVQSARPLEWIVVYTDPEGFAKQTVVRGETPPRPSIDADMRTSTAR